MTKSNGVLAAIVLVAGVGAIPAAAAPIRRAHRPWLMVHSGSHHSSRASRRSAPEVVDATPVAAQPEVPATKPSLDISESPTGDRIAEQASRYQGTRYRFGGTNKHDGIDCSGLVMRVFEDLKMKRLPHASAELYRSGDPVATSDLRPGDLVFFKNTYRHGISHVGVYAGHNKFIHAADHRHGVIMTALSDPYYQLHYAGARRLY